MTDADQFESLTTRSGLVLRVRPAVHDDSDLLRAFFAKVTPDDLRFRFLGGGNSVSEAQIAMMVDVDHRQTEDFLAFGDDGALVATSMIAKDPSGRKAEVAIVVRADVKGKGIGWSMLNHAATYAKRNGVEVLESLELRQNQSAIEVERDSGFLVRACPDDPTMVIVSRQLA